MRIDPQVKLFKHLGKLEQLQRGKHPTPVNVEIDLSNRCSLGCEWCHFAYTHTRGPLTASSDKALSLREKQAPLAAISGGDLMDTALAIDIVVQLADAGVQSITWTGGGEPTLHPDFDTIIEAAASTGIKQGIYTHGGHISEVRANLLTEYMAFVYVSLDAANRDSYKEAKGVDRFDAACQGIMHLTSSFYQTSLNNPDRATIGVGFLVNENNWFDMEDAAELATGLGADYIQFRPTIQYDNDDPTKLAEDPTWINDAINTINRIKTAYHDQAPSFTVEADPERFLMYKNWTGHNYEMCWWSALQTVITPNGKMWTCVNKREHPAALIGDLSTTNFQQIWEDAPIALVNKDCRVMCRGHLVNQALSTLDSPSSPHDSFI